MQKTSAFTRKLWRQTLFAVLATICLAPSAYAHITIGKGVTLDVANSVLTSDGITTERGGTLQVQQGRVYVEHWNNHGRLLAHAGTVNIRMGGVYVSLLAAPPAGQCLECDTTMPVMVSNVPIAPLHRKTAVERLASMANPSLPLTRSMPYTTASQRMRLNLLLGAPQIS